jgi:hypothetical protein
MNLGTEVILTICIVAALAGMCFVGWLVWVVLTDFYDHCMGRYKRIRNRKIDASVGRDVYRFVSGVHK